MQFYEAQLAICQLQRTRRLNKLFQLVIRSGNVSEEDCTRLRRMFHWQLLLPGGWDDGAPQYQARDFERLEPNCDHIGLLAAATVLRQIRLDNERNPNPVARARRRGAGCSAASTGNDRCRHRLTGGRTAATRTPARHRRGRTAPPVEPGLPGFARCHHPVHAKKDRNS